MWPRNLRRLFVASTRRQTSKNCVRTQRRRRQSQRSPSLQREQWVHCVRKRSSSVSAWVIADSSPPKPGSSCSRKSGSGLLPQEGDLATLASAPVTQTKRPPCDWRSFRSGLIRSDFAFGLPTLPPWGASLLGAGRCENPFYQTQLFEMGVAGRGSSERG